MSTATCPRCGVRLAAATQQCPCGGQSFQLFGTTFSGSQIVDSPAIADARNHMFRSILLAAVAAPAALLALRFAGIDRRLLLAGGVAAGYIAWASYWGFVGISDMAADPRWERIAKRSLIFGTHRLGLYGAVIVPLAAGIVFGTLGGGIVCFRRYRRLLAGDGRA